MQLAFANDGAVSSALRELHQLAAARRTWSARAVVSVIAGLIGPFGTFVDLGLTERLTYWVLAVIGSFFVGAFSMDLCTGWLGSRVSSKPIVMALSVPIAAIPISAFVVGLGCPFGMVVAGPDIFALYAHVAVIAFGASILFSLLADEGKPPSAEATPAGATPVGATTLRATPAILRRLPTAKRGALIRLAVHDHYVDVVTERGRDLERQLSENQRQRMARAYRNAGAESVEGFRTVLRNLIDARDRARFETGEPATKVATRR